MPCSCGRRLVDRHEVLRTVYPATARRPGAGGPAAPVQAVPDLRAGARRATGTDRRALERGAAVRAPGFDVTAEVPLRVRCCRVGPDELRARGGRAPHRRRRLVDGPAGPRRDGRLRRARATGAAPRWAPLPVQYADYALWQRELLGDEDDPESLAATSARLLAAGPGRICRTSSTCPTDRPRPAVQSHRGGRGAVRDRRRHPRARWSIWPARTERHAVHGGARRARGAAGPAVGHRRHRDRHARRGPRRGARSTTSSACSSTPWCSAPTSTRRPVRRRCSAAHAGARSRAPSRTPTCRSSGSSRCSTRPGPRARHPLFQVGSRSRTWRATTLELPGLAVAGVDVRRADLAVRSAPDRSSSSTTPTAARRIEGHIHLRHRPVRRGRRWRGSRTRLHSVLRRGRSPTRRSRSATSTCSTGANAAVLAAWNATAHPVAAGDAGGAVRPAGGANPGRGRAGRRRGSD